MKNLTIITAVKNAENTIVNLIESLNSQSSKNFSWLIIDSNSTDKTLFLIKKLSKMDYEIFSQDDFSIYHALNIAIPKIQTEYYCVAGADDTFSKSFVENVDKILVTKKYDIIFGSIISNRIVYKPQLKYKFISPVNASHSIGTIIKTELHQTIGMYSKMYPIVADKKFVMDVLKLSKNIYFSNTIFGNYSQEGFSSVNSLDYICDLYKLQIKYQQNIFIQSILLFFRILKIKITR